VATVSTGRLTLRGSVPSRSDTGDMLRQPGDAALIERGRPRVLVLLCPCGCGDQLSINLDRQAGPAWRMFREGNSVSLFPSIWRETGCESHFIVRKNRIYLFGRREDDESGEWDELWYDDSTVRRDVVLNALSRQRLESYRDIAARLEALPWDVLVVCRRLVIEGLALEGSGVFRAQFRKR
jgi:Family of unknown function (DUF6527)